MKQSLMERIEAVEGREPSMYMLAGVPHIGIGHNIVSRPLADETLEELGIEDESELMNVTLNDEQINFLFNKDLQIAITDVSNVIGQDVFGNLDEVRQDVLVDMSFNLGRPRFSKFKKMIAAVQDGDFDEAANQILDSKAARDPLTSGRYQNLANEMRFGAGHGTRQVEAPAEAPAENETPETAYQLLVRIEEKLDQVLAKLNGVG